MGWEKLTSRNRPKKFPINFDSYQIELSYLGISKDSPQLFFKIKEGDQTPVSVVNDTQGRGEEAKIIGSRQRKNKEIIINKKERIPNGLSISTLLFFFEVVSLVRLTQSSDLSIYGD
ncbi:hypothetical protein CbuD7D7780_11075 [Coxiella burnetii]|uniref:Uncharacterized protein n=1 Tax=Coxiella burnetii (strain Dugway 5J108-111) TaxID=434922 RepID=B5XHL5_COXBN|nr:hypothetical protein CBUD_2138a [Coxiella burnetii Dugway 5J108-111]OYK79284.1 hypothetical protein CbuD7E6568_11060 [Coxiella burnetii]OYK81365.1 hypothetical protein CbuD7D7780_11075 [Coxiella burnetii]